jgi:hypothetical protein
MSYLIIEGGLTHSIDIHIDIEIVLVFVAVKDRAASIRASEQRRARNSIITAEIR